MDYKSNFNVTYCSYNDLALTRGMAVQVAPRQATTMPLTEFASFKHKSNKCVFPF